MTGPILFLVLGVLVSASVALADAPGIWTTYLRPTRFTDLIATRDAVWCASFDGGLARFDRARGTFTSLLRTPGGLASNTLTALALDRSGRLWIGTNGGGVSGLAADGHSWTRLTTLDGLPSDSISVLRADGDSLWIGTAREFALWDGHQIALRVALDALPSPAIGNSVRGIAHVGDSLWVETYSWVYVSRISTGLSSWTPVYQGLGASTLGMAWDGRSLMVLSHDPFVFDFASGQWKQRGGIGEVYRLWDHGGAILASSNQGIFRWDGAVWTLVNGDLRSTGYCRPSDPACPWTFAAATDESGRLFAANRTGLYEQVPGGAPWLRHDLPGPPGNDILNLALDRSRLYVTTLGDGVGRLDAGGWRIWGPGPCTTGCDTTFSDPEYTFALLVDRLGRKWAASWTAAMEWFDDFAVPPSFTHLWQGEPIPNKHTCAWSAAADSNGGRWFGMDTPCLGGDPGMCDPIGLDFYDATGAFARNYDATYPGIADGRIHALAVDRTGQVWVAFASRGLARFTPPASAPWDLSLIPIPGTQAWEVADLAAREDSIWVLTTTELVRLDRGNPDPAAAARIPIPAPPPDPLALRPLEVGPDGTIWVGTTQGVHILRPDGSTGDFTTANSPLLSNDIRAVCVDQTSGVAWIGTMGGLFRFAPVPPAPGPDQPRGPGFWSQQCAAKGNGSTKLTMEQMRRIAACADAHASAFDWGSASLAGLCATLDPPRPMDPRKQALRQFATVLANLCAGENGEHTTDGQLLGVLASTPIACDGFGVKTVGEFVRVADSLLVALANRPIIDRAARAAWEHISDCASSLQDGSEAVSGEERSAGRGGNAHSAPGTLAARPNPFAGGTRIHYTIPGTGSVRVELSVYDLAGRRVRRLESGFAPAGEHAVSWDGRDDRGAQVRAGVYFVRGTTDGQGVASRILLLH